jgi:hypothetical protein
MKIFITGHNAWVPLVKGTPTSIAQRFQAHGLEIVDNIATSDAYVSVDFHLEELKRNQNVNGQALILIRLEPGIVWPLNYSKLALNSFGLTIDVGRNPMINKSSVPWPQDWSTVIQYSASEKIYFDEIAMVCGNKLSFIPGELYSLRRRCIHEIDAIALFGSNWGASFSSKLKIYLGEIAIAFRNKKRPRFLNARFWFYRGINWRGAPESKLDVLSEFKMTLVIENSIDYMTEKLFDAFFARSIPIYVGPPISDYGIPDNLVIQAKPDINSIIDAIQIAKSTDFDAWKVGLEDWLYLDSTREKWSQESVHDLVVQKSIEFIDADQKS